MNQDIKYQSVNVMAEFLKSVDLDKVTDEEIKQTAKKINDGFAALELDCKKRKEVSIIMTSAQIKELAAIAEKDGQDCYQIRENFVQDGDGSLVVFSQTAPSGGFALK